MKFKFLIAAALVLFANFAQAFDPKGQTINVLIGFAPGGGTDNVIKPYLEKMAELGYNTNIEYKPGAESTIAMNHFGTAVKADGMTIAVAASSGLILTEVFKKEMIQHSGFEYVSVVGYGPNVLITGADNDIRTFADFEKDIKSNPGKKSFAAGSLLGEVAAKYLVNKLGAAKDSIVIAKYKGMNPATQDIAGGHVKYALVPMNVAAPLVEAGKVRVLAIGGTVRNSKMPDVPTFVESVKGYSPETTESNWGIILPKDTPKEIVEFYSTLFTRIGSEKSLQDKLAKGFIFIKSEDLGTVKYKALVERSLTAWKEVKN